MLLLVLAYFGGVLTILSPCILPVIPFVFARTGRSFWQSSFPLLVGMALTFALVATVASVGGGWAVQANAYGRYIALAVLALFGVTLLLPSVAERITRPLVRIGGNLSNATGQGGSRNFWQSLVLGIATGLLWAPCAGPILGLVLTGAALGGGRVWTAVLLFAYALGAATSLGVAIFAGQRAMNAMKRSLGIEEAIRRGLGVLILVGVAVIGLGLDHGLLTRLSGSSTNALEEGLIARVQPGMVNREVVDATGKVKLGNEGAFPAVPAAGTWINSSPLTKESLRGHVVLVDFWTYSCINCLRSLPYVINWANQYKNAGLVVIGVHTPEFAFEKERPNVEKAVKDLGIPYPVALDNDYTIWNAFHNQYWPAHYLIDSQGTIRYHHFGEGRYEETESAVRQLLAANGATLPPPLTVSGRGIAQAADDRDIKTPETYLGQARRQNYVDPSTQASALQLNEWTLKGKWNADLEHVELAGGSGELVFRFHARDAHVVLGSDAPVPFTVLLDGKAPGKDAGVDVDANGHGTVSAQRLYGVVRLQGPVRDHTLTIRFEKAKVNAYSLTFG